jgi:rare lipoprotein A
MNKSLISGALGAVLLASGLTGLLSASNAFADSPGHRAKSGMASYYHDRFHGRRTASGAAYNKNALSAAHKTLPLGTQVRVTNTRSGRSVVVRINDRGPYARGRVIDLSRAAASEIGMVGQGVARVQLEILGREGI